MIQDLSGSWYIKGTDESMTRADSSIEFMFHFHWAFLNDRFFPGLCLTRRNLNKKESPHSAKQIRDLDGKNRVINMIIKEKKLNLMMMCR